MSTRDLAQLARLEASGNLDASLILSLHEACQQARDAVDGLSLAMGLQSDVDDILNSVTEDMLDALLPTLLKMSGAWALPQSGGFESLRWHVSINQMLEIAIFNHKRFHGGREPMEIALSAQWQSALGNAHSYDYHGIAVYLSYKTHWPTTRLLCTEEPEEGAGTEGTE